MNRIPMIAAVAVVSLAAAVPSAPAVTDGPAAEASAKNGKKGNKKKKKRKKTKRPVAAPTAPATPSAPAEESPPVPSPEPEPEPEPPCEGDDSAEQDDDPFHATVIEWPGTTMALNRFLCPGDRDFFEITIPASSYLQFAAQANPDVVLEVYDGGELPISTENSRGPAQTEDIQISNPYGSPLTRWIAVAGATPTETGSYSATGSET